MTRFAVRFAVFAGFSLSAFAQLDAYKLRDKYGPPVDRETFTVRPGIEMVLVDYGLNKQVCRIQLPSGMQYVGTIPDGAVTKQQIGEVLQEVAPASMRGKEINKMFTVEGLAMECLQPFTSTSPSVNRTMVRGELESP